MEVSWLRPTGNFAGSVFRYLIYYWDLDTPCSFLGGAAFASASGSINGLVSGHRYLVAVEAWNAAGASIPGFGRDVIPDRGTPVAPINLQIEAGSETDVLLTWDKPAGAAGYWLWRRNINENSALERLVDHPVGPDNCEEWPFQFPGEPHPQYADFVGGF